MSGTSWSKMQSFLHDRRLRTKKQACLLSLPYIAQGLIHMCEPYMHAYFKFDWLGDVMHARVIHLNRTRSRGNMQGIWTIPCDGQNSHNTHNYHLVHKQLWFNLNVTNAMSLVRCTHFYILLLLSTKSVCMINASDHPMPSAKANKIRWREQWDPQYISLLAL